MALDRDKIETVPVNKRGIPSTPNLDARRIGLTWKLVLTSFLGASTVWLALSPYWLSAIWTGLITVGLLYHLLRQMNRAESRLTTFLESLKQNDFTINFPEHDRADDYPLHLAFNQLTETFQRLRSEKESQHQLLQVIVSHAAVPLICFDEATGDVYIVNDAARELLQVPFLRNIKALSRSDALLPETLTAIRDGDKLSMKIVVQGKAIFLSVSSRHILFDGKNLKLVALTDVSSEKAASEADAWQKLLRVLTHEISNSAIPLSTLSAYAFEMVSTAEGAGRPLTPDERKDVLESLQTIDARSKSLKEFVGNFKNVNKTPEPKMEKVLLSSLVREVSVLFAKELVKENINLTVDLKEDESVSADKNLSVQVLINLVKNAIESMETLKEGKRIRIHSERVGSLLVNLHVTDSGCGIPQEDADQIFVPFYSTKKSGSGIGLSIARQIMQRQRGDLTVASEPGNGSIFTASFILSTP